MNSYKIELYRGAERKLVQRIDFMEIVRMSLQPTLGSQLDDAKIVVQLVQIPEDIPLLGIPIVENLVPEFGYAYVQIVLGQYIVYQHPHTIADLIARSLQSYLKKQYPEERMWGFRLDVPGMPPISPRRETPNVSGQVTVETSTGSTSRFTIRNVTEDAQELCSLRDFGIEAKSDSRLKVVLSKYVYQQLVNFKTFSDQVEEGGFMTGHVYKDREGENGYIVYITDVPSAQQTGASLLHFTFTGDSFAMVKQHIRQSDTDLKLLGWYHTHLFPATPSFGLSSIDVTLHLTTFKLAWQLAGLVNIDFAQNDQRTLRFYGSENDQMVLFPHWVEN